MRPDTSRYHRDMPVIVISFHSRILDAITGMICGYASPMGGVIFDHRHNTGSRATCWAEQTKRYCRFQLGI